jgi:hypothetical protein
MMREREPYLAYMLRLWLVDEKGPIWRASLESPHTGERHTFADPQKLLAFLEEKTGFRPQAAGEEGDTQ